MDSINHYLNIKGALINQIKSYLESKGKTVDVYSVPLQNITMFPAVSIELQTREKAKVGLGVRQLNFVVNVWVYTKVVGDSEDAEQQGLELTQIVEDAIESDKTLNGTSDYLSIDDVSEFGFVSQTDGMFLHFAKIPLTIEKRIMKGVDSIG